MTCQNSTEDMQLLWGRGARGNAPGGRTRSETDLLRLEVSACGNQSMHSDARHRWLNDLMVQMADRASVGRGTGMIMPDHSKCRAYHQRQNRYWEHQPPESFSIRHFDGPQ